MGAVPEPAARDQAGARGQAGAAGGRWEPFGGPARAAAGPAARRRADGEATVRRSTPAALAATQVSGA